MKKGIWLRNMVRFGIGKNKKEPILYIAAILTAAFIGYLSLGWGYDFDVLPAVDGDGMISLAYIKSIRENGFTGVLFNPRVGAPDRASAFIDFPAFGVVFAVIARIISLFSDSDSRTMYLYLITTFVLDGMSMVLLLRKLKTGRAASFVFGMLFAAAPFHYYRFLGHLSLSSYMSVPITIYLCGYIIGAIDEDEKWKLAVATVVLGLEYGYFYMFGLMVLMTAYVVLAVSGNGIRCVADKLWIAGLLLATVIMSLLPKTAYSMVSGPNTEAGRRQVIEQEIYGLKIVNLLMPVSYTRVPVFRKITEAYQTSAPLVNENITASLGTVGSAGFLFLIGMAAMKLAGRETEKNSGAMLINFMSLATVAFLLVGTIGGLGEIFNWAVTPQIRCYNRCSIFLTGFALTALALLLMKMPSHKWALLISGFILIIGLFDQARIGDADAQGGVKASQKQYEEYFGEAEHALGGNAMVYQLPYADFPEAGAVNTMNDYKHFVGYIFTDSLRWSYGGVRGRNVAAKELNIDEGMSYAFLRGVVDAGFSAVYIDTDGYADGGAQILSFYDSLGVEPMVSPDGKLFIYDISNVVISEEMETPGYGFIKSFAAAFGHGPDGRLTARLARGLDGRDKDAYGRIFVFAKNDPAVRTGSDEEYVAFLYRKLLGREPDPDGFAGHIGELANGAGRDEIFYRFLESGEFRGKWDLTQ